MRHPASRTLDRSLRSAQRLLATVVHTFPLPARCFVRKVVERSQLLRTIRATALKFEGMATAEPHRSRAAFRDFPGRRLLELINNVSSHACNRRTSSSRLPSAALMRLESHCEPNPRKRQTGSCSRTLRPHRSFSQRSRKPVLLGSFVTKLSSEPIERLRSPRHLGAEPSLIHTLIQPTPLVVFCYKIDALASMEEPNLCPQVVEVRYPVFLRTYLSLLERRSSSYGQPAMSEGLSLSTSGRPILWLMPLNSLINLAAGLRRLATRNEV